MVCDGHRVPGPHISQMATEVIAQFPNADVHAALPHMAIIFHIIVATFSGFAVQHPQTYLGYDRGGVASGEFTLLISQRPSTFSSRITMDN